MLLKRIDEGLNPTTPQNDAGIRIEPATSVPTAMGTHFMATRVASPPDEPPKSKNQTKKYARKIAVLHLLSNSINQNSLV